MIYVLSGSGEKLNYKVVGGTVEPTNPSENTIWVNTSQTIHNHAFSITQPLRVSNNKNLLVYPFYHTTRTASGIKWTDNKDGTVTANGTATATAYFRHSYNDEKGLLYTGMLEPGTYTLSGCPAGGSDSTYQIEFGYSYNNFANTTWITDVGNGVTFTVLREARFRCSLAVFKSTVVSNIIFKPQLEKGSAITTFIKGDASGQIWIKCGETSNFAFNAIKKNTIMISPLEVQQIINGQFADVVAQVFQNNVWNTLITDILLFDGSNDVTDISGGWEKHSGTGSLTISGNYMHLAVGAKAYGANEGYFRAINKIDLTAYSTVSALYENLLRASGRGSLCVFSDDTTIVASTDFSDSKTELTINVSSLKGEYYIGFTLKSYYDGVDWASGEVDITKVEVIV